MSLADRKAQIVRRQHGPRCLMCLTLDRLGKEDKATLLGWLKDSAMRSTEIAEALTLEGHRIRSHVVARHRRGECGHA